MRPRTPLLALVGAVVLAAVTTAAVGLRDRPVPERVVGGWQVAHVPAGLWGLLAVVVGICLVTATVLTRWATGLRTRDPAFLLWLGVVLAAAAGLVWDVLFMSSMAAEVAGPVIPVFDWLYTLVPGLLAVLATRSRGRRAAMGAALGTGVVTVPLYALGWALFLSRDAFGGGLGAVLWNTAVLGLGPLLLAVAAGRARSAHREHS